jgi:hypothetical protein
LGEVSWLTNYRGLDTAGSKNDAAKKIIAAMAVLVAEGVVVSTTPLLRVQTKRDDSELYDDDDVDACCDEYLLATGSSSGSSSSASSSVAEDDEGELLLDDEEESLSDSGNIPHTRNASRRRRFCVRLIPATHAFKLTWDIITFALSLWNAYLTHVAIRDRSFDYNRTRFVTEVWFAIDILLNFITERRVHGTTLTTFQSVSAYYLTTWFVIDVLSLLPGELLFVSPVIQRLQKRKRITVWWNRIKLIGRWTRKLIRDPHVRHASVLYTRRKGVRAASKMVRLLTFYIPKYFMFIRNMKAVIGFRILRQVRLVRHMFVRRDVTTTTTDGRTLLKQHQQQQWQDDSHDDDDGDDNNDDLSLYDDDDDGSPY